MLTHALFTSYNLNATKDALWDEHSVSIVIPVGYDYIFSYGLLWFYRHTIYSGNEKTIESLFNHLKSLRNDPAYRPINCLYHR